LHLEFAVRRCEIRHFQNAPGAKQKGFASVIAIFPVLAKYNAMPTNNLQRAPKKRPMQNPLNREVYDIMLAPARSDERKTLHESDDTKPGGR
jgi:hypothetical protein